jgi:PBSX family phage terminase large subunit
MDTKDKKKRKVPNPTGKGGFGERPQDINVGGAPRKGQSWAEVVKRITDMTRDEAMEYVGKNTRLGKLLKELPPKLPLKDAMVFASIVHYGREPNARMFQVLTDREEGKPKEQPQQSGGESAALVIPAHMLARDFTDVYRDIINRGHTEYALDGGRGSAKSSFVAMVSIMLLVNNPEWHMLAMRQVSDTLRKSVYSQLTWAISELGLDDKFKSTLSPLEIKYIPTGQTIYFSGASDPKNLKSIKPPFGYIALLWFEEYDQFAGEAAIRSIVQSALRGGDVAYRFETWNTPRSKNHWCNKYIAIPKEGRYHLRTNYLNVPNEWLGKVFIDEAEFLKSVNLDAYKHEYLGEATGIGGTVFENVEIRAITDQEIKTFNGYNDGIDWGYYPDPFVWGRSYYDPKTTDLYIYDEYYVWKQSNEETYKYLVKNKKLSPNDLIIADSSEPKSVADYKKYGANIRGAEKGADSVNYSMKWLQTRRRIIIDNIRAPHHAEEFLNYELEQTKDGEYITKFPDKNNHCIDRTRYAHNLLWRKAGE